MTVLDAFALVAYFREEPASQRVQELLWSTPLAISQIQFAEVIDRMVRIDGHDPDDIEVAVHALAIEVLDVLDDDGATAGRLRAEEYRPTGRTLSMADAFAAVVALRTRRPLATADPVLIDVIRRHGGDAVVLPPSG
jgi:PIN domain nuclease of toxin-antitoxin system